MKKKKFCIVGIIPARGGSKSIPNKNIKKINDKPLIEYTIVSAIKSNIFDFIIVSSDSEKILRIAKKNEVICLKRPKNISTDKSKTEEALMHACDHLIDKYKKQPDIIVTLEPTAPLRSVATIQKCIKNFYNENCEAVIGVSSVNKCMGSVKKNRFIFNQKENRRRQDRKEKYLESGVIYATRYKTLLKHKSVLGKRPYALKIPVIESFDINEPVDFFVVESIIKNQSNKSKYDK